MEEGSVDPAASAFGGPPVDEGSTTTASAAIGPVRRKIRSFTLTLEPLPNGLTDAEAVRVRNAIESVLQAYLFEVQPWAIYNGNDDDAASNDPDGSYSVVGSSYADSIRDSGAGRNPWDPRATDGAVTYVGLVLEDKRTETAVATELTMTGLVYFAEGSRNPPDENELLETLTTEESALGNPDRVVEALRDSFPSLELVTVETEASEPVLLQPIATGETPGAVPETEIEAGPEGVSPATPAPEPPEQASNQVLAATGDHQNPVPFGTGRTAALAGGIGAAVVFFGLLVAGFVLRRKRRTPKSAGRGDFLVGLSSDSASLAFGSLSRDDWELVHGRGIRSTGNSDGNHRQSSDKPDAGLAPPSSRDGIRGGPVAVPIGHNHHHNNSQHYYDNHPRSVYDFSDRDGTVSDFSDVVSIQPHLASLQSPESFEEQHKGMLHQDLVVQKDQLESTFERRTSGPGPTLPPPPNNSSGNSNSNSSNHQNNPSVLMAITNPPTGVSAASNLSYSDSSVSSREQHSGHGLPSSRAAGEEDRDHGEDRGLRYSVTMPNPYFRRTSYPGRAPVEDRSSHSVLLATDTSAAGLARRRHSTSGAVDMVPKTSVPAGSFRKGKAGRRRRRSGSSGAAPKDRRTSAAAAAKVYSDGDDDDYLAYSGDEENTFGVPGSDGWDPADTELSSMGDPPTQEDIQMVLFDPRVGNARGQSLLNDSVRRESAKLRRKRLSPTEAAAGKGFGNHNQYALDRQSSYSSTDDDVVDIESNPVLRLDRSSDMEI